MTPSSRHCRWAALAVAILLARTAPAATPELPLAVSSVHPGPYLPEYAIDGDPKTRWASRAHAGRPEWLRIDFGQVRPVDSLVIHWEAAYAVEYQVQVSTDGKAWTPLLHQKAGRGGKEVLEGLAGKGRFLRLLFLKPGQHKLFSIWELDCAGGAPDQGMALLRKRLVAAREKAGREARRQLLTTVAKLDTDEIIFALRQPGRDGHWYANFGYYAQDERRLTYGNGGKLCRLDLKTGKCTALVDDPKGGVRDPVVHYDARKILFSYRKGGTPFYHLYEIDVDGQNLRQITDGPFDDIEPTYLPDGELLFVSSRCNRWVNCWVTPVGILYRCDAQGGNIRPVSCNVEHDNTPWPLPTGQILYTRWEYVDRSQVDYHHLWIMNPDGTAQMVYFGNMYPGLVMIDAKPIPLTNKVVSIFSPGHGRREHDGTVTVIDPRGGPDARPMARRIPHRGSLRDPWAFSESLFMAAQGDRIVLLDDQGHLQDLYRCTPTERKAGLQAHEPRPLTPRPREPIIPPRTQPKETTGQLMLMDIYTGRNMEGVRRGEIKKLLVLETLPKPINFTGGMDPVSYGGTFTLERIVGTVPVEPDGSAYMEVPALRSLFFVALDHRDIAVKRMHSFLTVMPGETTGCVGCHENRFETPMNPASGTPLALQRPPSTIQPIADCPDVLDFPRDIQPILNTLCVDCHGYTKTKRGGPYDGKIALTGDRGPMFSHAYFTMTVRQLFSDNRNLPRGNLPPRATGSGASRILTMLDGSHHGVKATDRQKKMLRLWIDLGAPYPGTYAALGCGAVGGYWQNRLMNTDFAWPTTKAGAAVIQRRCAACHTGHNILPKAMSDERRISFWRFNIKDPRLKLSRHIVFNLTRPEKSLLLLAPLAKDAGGLELCRDKQGQPVAILPTTDHPDYRALLAMVDAGRANLDTIKRFDMPGFRPMPQYLREMKRYGILPADLAPDAPIDPYATDQRYWRSFWHPAAATQRHEPQPRPSVPDNRSPAAQLRPSPRTTPSPTSSRCPHPSVP